MEQPKQQGEDQHDQPSANADEELSNQKDSEKEQQETATSTSTTAASAAEPLKEDKSVFDTMTPPTTTATATPSERKDEKEQQQEGEDKDKEMTKEELIEEALNCPCIASMKEGSCGTPFIGAYRCFLESETEPKGMDCMDQFQSMQACIAEHPDEYNFDDEEDEQGGEGGNPFNLSSSDSKDKQEGKKETTTEEEDKSLKLDKPVTESISVSVPSSSAKVES